MQQHMHIAHMQEKNWFATWFIVFCFYYLDRLINSK